VDPTSADDLETMREQLLLFARDLQVIVGEERRQRTDAETAYRELSTSYLSMVKTLAMVCEMKDRHTHRHLERTYDYAMALTREVAPELAAEPAVGYGYLLHDIGKIGVPDHILNKQGPLDDDEWRVMRLHPLNGWQLVQGIKFLGDAALTIRYHHERWDGRGYPEGVKGEDIYIGARIFSISDTFDAMTSDRPYRKGLPVHAALEEIESGAGTQFDPELARRFVALCERLKVGHPDQLSFVR
jgi:HD-GYP domain-containing protein (c-di-GMP phosphodiesterase class II)